MKPRLLDLFCGAGGCSVGYHRSGFDVVGVDNRPMPRYPFEFHQADALEFLAAHGREFDAIHASPPCQRYSSATQCNKTQKKSKKPEEHPDLVAPTRKLLLVIGKPWVIENVVNAPMRAPAVLLCGLMFGLKVFRHRWFESSAFLLVPTHRSHGERRIGKDGFCCVAGNGGGSTAKWRGGKACPWDHRSKAAWQKAMGVDWMSQKELAQSIPPAYTEFIGRQLADQLSSCQVESDNVT